MTPSSRSPKPKLVVLDGHTVNPGDNPWDALAALGDLTVYDRTPPGKIVERALDAEIVLTNKTPLSAVTINALPRLQFISVLATGYDCVDVEAARARGIPVSNVPEYGTESVAQHVFALIFALTNKVAEHDAAVKRGEWSRSPDFSFWLAPPMELAGKVMGVVGLGRIGRRVAEIAQAFGMETIAATRSKVDVSGVRSVPLAELFATADVVSLHCPLTPETRGLVNADLLARMKPTAFLVNAARGGLVDEAALASALRARKLAGAAFDVASREPIDPANPLLAAPFCFVTPHMAWASHAARERLLTTSVENIRAFLGNTPRNRVA